MEELVPAVKSILCLNGDLPAASAFPTSLPIIAADGAANSLMHQGLKPDLVIGDLDSLDVKHRSLLKLHEHSDQNYCDYEKALFYLQKQHLLPALILGLNGGELDHILNNVNLLMGTNNIAYANPILCLAMRAGQTKAFELMNNSKISLIGLPYAKVSSEGLQWELSDAALHFPGNTSCFNRNRLPTITIHVSEGDLLALIHVGDLKLIQLLQLLGL